MRSSKRDLKKVFQNLLQEIDPPAGQLDVQKAFVRKLVEFTEAWGRNFPGNPAKIKKLEQEIFDWIDNS